MEGRCSHCLQVVSLGDGGCWPPWCPHCGADFGSKRTTPLGEGPEVMVGKHELGAANRSRRWSLGDILAALAFLAILGVIVAGIAQVANWDPDKPLRETHLARWRALSQDVPALVEFHHGERHLTITNRAEVEEFLRLVCEGKKMHPHHSHPVDVVALSLPGLADTYFLGHDSWQADEYWLTVQWPEKPGPNTAQRVVQFSSPGMGPWLQRNKVAALTEVRKP